MFISHLPAVDAIASRPGAQMLVAQFGRPAVIDAIRKDLANLRGERKVGPRPDAGNADENILDRVAGALARQFAPSLGPVFNLTGTVLHTNLGRAPLPPEAIAAMVNAAGAANLEYDLDSGKRGERDDHVEGLIRRLTGAEAATVVNNNAAAVLLVLNALACRREVPVSRGELIEIGASFRLPDIMARAGCRLVEVGTTNRTHLADFESAIGPRTGVVLKAHASNFSMRGFTASVASEQLAACCRARGVPLVIDLGSGSLIDLSAHGLPHEPTVREVLTRGADLVTFSGDKLLGGPQAGVIAGRADLVAKVRKSPLKRALRIDKVTLAALAAVLRLYLNPDQLRARLPALRLLTRPVADIRAAAARAQPHLARQLAGWADVAVVETASQMGSGAQPDALLPSAGLSIVPVARRGRGGALRGLASGLRALPVPVIGRIDDDRLILDFRCAEDDTGLVAQLALLVPPS
jgi:L-seryl-tRNA(Ser) seleniumtransferase